MDRVVGGAHGEGPFEGRVVGSAILRRVSGPGTAGPLEHLQLRVPPAPPARQRAGPYVAVRYSVIAFASASLIGAPKTLIIFVTTASHCRASPRGCITM